MIMARVVPSKGLDPYAVESTRKGLEQLGHRRVILRSDNEPAILALKEAVRRESDLEIVLEEVPVNDHQANGLVENAAKNVQGQFRVLKDALESRVGRRIQMVGDVRGVGDQQRQEGSRRVHTIPEMEGARVQQACGGVWRMCSLCASVLGRKEQVRCEMARRSLAGDQVGERGVDHRHGRGSCEGQRLQEKTGERWEMGKRQT